MTMKVAGSHNAKRQPEGWRFYPARLVINLL